MKKNYYMHANMYPSAWRYFHLCSPFFIFQVKLQGLKTDLVRRPVYFYPTLKQCEDKLTLLDSRQALLDKKQGKNKLNPIFKFSSIFLNFHFGGFGIYFITVDLGPNYI